MQHIEDKDIYGINYFTYKKPFTGSRGNMRYRIIRSQKEEGDAVLEAAVYPQPYCWEETEDVLKQRKEFPFSEEGREEMIAWLNEKIQEFDAV